jgi:uncharacterized damage-inducible protein DinB
MSLAQAYLDDVRFSFRKMQTMAEQALRQLEDEQLFRTPGEQVNSIAVIMKHLAGNLKARWTDFLTSDGDKPWRDRDREFVIGPGDSRVSLQAAWQEAWEILLGTLDQLQEGDLLRTVTIRGEAHTVLQAIQRALAHSAHHVGQILYVARLVKPAGWQWITIPPGQSEAHRAKGGSYLQEPGGRAGPSPTS